MNAENKRCTLTTAVTEKEKNSFVEIAHDLDAPCDLLMRRLVHYFLDGKISWMELFKQSNELLMKNMPDNSRKVNMRTHLSPARYVAFTQITEYWGSSTAVVLRRLILLYVAGKIERADIWR
jgi:hypothetical protein